MSKKLRKQSSSVNVARWASYATAGAAAALALSNDAEATIYYSGAINVTVNPSHDFIMSALSHGHGAMAFPGYFEIGSFFAASNGGLGNDLLEKFGSNQPNALNPHFVGFESKGPNSTYQFPSRLAAGVKISSQHFTNKFGRASAILALHTYPLAGSKWSSAGTGFLGFELKNNGTAEQYGWARITTTNSGTSYTIVDYAIGSPGVAIVTGETSLPVPEPATLGLLAIGAAGLLAMRRGGRPNVSARRF